MGVTLRPASSPKWIASDMNPRASVEVNFGSINSETALLPAAEAAWASCCADSVEGAVAAAPSRAAVLRNSPLLRCEVFMHLFQFSFKPSVFGPPATVRVYCRISAVADWPGGSSTVTQLARTPWIVAAAAVLSCPSTVIVG